jgi:nucleoside-diphosphate-sugar epimerase
MRVLVTGGTGFVGRHAVKSLLASGHIVVCTSRAPQRDTNVEWIDSDLLKPGEAARVVHVANPDAILHLAWATEHGKFWTDATNLAWVAASCELASAALKHGVRRFCASGTCFEYDWPPQGDCDEAKTPAANHHLYDTAKDSCRRALAAFASQYEISFAWGRMFLLYGPHEHPARLVPSVARAILAGRPAECSSGAGLRDFMDTRDAGAAIAALTISNVQGTVNIASGEPRKIADVARMIGDISGRSELIRLGALADRKNEPPRITAVVNRLRDEVGFRSSISLETGLRDALDFWTKASDELPDMWSA